MHASDTPLTCQASLGGLAYGNYMALSLAVGFLFLGGGAYTFGSSNEAVAALVISLYPVFPQVTSDNKHHLQAYRHLYTLAAEPRCLRALDVDSSGSQDVFVPVELTLRDQAPGDVRPSNRTCCVSREALALGLYDTSADRLNCRPPAARASS